MDTDFAILIARANGGERAALERLLLDHYDPLLQHIERRLPASIRSVVGAMDILQQSFIQVFRHIGQFNGDGPTAFFAWLKTIAERAIKDAIKSAQRKKRGAGLHQVHRARPDHDGSLTNLAHRLIHAGNSPSQSVARREVVHAMRVAIATLPEDYQQAVRLRYFDGQSVDQAASTMGRSPGAVRGLIDRAKEKLRASIGRLSVYI